MSDYESGGNTESGDSGSESNEESLEATEALPKTGVVANPEELFTTENALTAQFMVSMIATEDKFFRDNGFSVKIDPAHFKGPSTRNMHIIQGMELSMLDALTPYQLILVATDGTKPIPGINMGIRPHDDASRPCIMVINANQKFAGRVIVAVKKYTAQEVVDYCNLPAGLTADALAEQYDVVKEQSGAETVLVPETSPLFRVISMFDLLPGAEWQRSRKLKKVLMSKESLATARTKAQQLLERTPEVDVSNLYLQAAVLRPKEYGAPRNDRVIQLLFRLKILYKPLEQVAAE